MSWQIKMDWNSMHGGVPAGSSSGMHSLIPAPVSNDKSLVGVAPRCNCKGFMRNCMVLVPEPPQADGCSLGSSCSYRPLHLAIAHIICALPTYQCGQERMCAQWNMHIQHDTQVSVSKHCGYKDGDKLVSVSRVVYYMYVHASSKWS